MKVRSRPGVLRQPRWLPVGVLHHRSFRLLWLGLLPGTLGIMMASVAFGYLAYDLTGAATAIGLVSMGWGISLVVVSPVGGVVADRFPRLRVIQIAQAAVGLTGAILALLVATGTVQLWHLTVATLIQGSVFALLVPARQALIAQLVRSEDLAQAVGLANAGMNLNRILGPALAGLLISQPRIGITGVFASMAALYMLSIASLARLQVPSVPGTSRVRPAGRAQLTEGFRYVISQRPVVMLLVLAVVPTFFGMPYSTLMPAIAAQVFQVDATGLGTLLAANGCGAIVGALVAGAFGGSRHARRLPRVQLGAGLLFGLGLVLFALAGTFRPALAILPLVGAASAAYTSVNNTLLILQTTPAYHGRVMSVYMMAVAAMPLSTLPAARVADAIGLQATIIGAGALVLLSVLLITTLTRYWVPTPAAPATPGARPAAPAAPP